MSCRGRCNYEELVRVVKHSITQYKITDVNILYIIIQHGMTAIHIVRGVHTEFQLSEHVRSTYGTAVTVPTTGLLAGVIR